MNAKSIRLCALLALTLHALGQASFQRVPLIADSANYVGASMTNTNGVGVSVARVDNIGLFIRQQPAATNIQANVVYTFARGISASELENPGSVSIAIPTSTNATVQTVWRNVTVQGAGYLKLVSISNFASVPLTNIAVIAVVKVPATVPLSR